jgi:hypothetical protein
MNPRFCQIARKKSKQKNPYESMACIRYRFCSPGRAGEAVLPHRTTSFVHK